MNNSEKRAFVKAVSQRINAGFHKAADIVEEYESDTIERKMAMLGFFVAATSMFTGSLLAAAEKHGPTKLAEVATIVNMLEQLVDQLLMPLTKES